VIGAWQEPRPTETKNKIETKMKTAKQLLTGLAVVVACVCAALLFTDLTPKNAEAQSFVGQTLSTNECFTNIMPVTTSATTNVVGPNRIALFNKQGCSVVLKVGTTNAGVNTSLIGVGFAVSQDGSNFTHNPYFWVVGAANSTAAGIIASNIPAFIVDNFRWCKAITATNGNTNTFYFTNATVGNF
jgi:hypothetical protein